MRILCLHGWGTNGNVLESQTAALRYLLGEEHDYSYVDGAIIWPTAPGIEAVFGKDDDYYTYFIPDSAFGILSAVNYLADHIASEGPFEAVMGFSQGASLAATLILRDQEIGNGASLSVSQGQQRFKCAIFLSGQLPFDYAALERGEIRQLDPDRDEILINIPTANFWGVNDTLYPDASPKLSRLCVEDCRSEVTHMAGHGIPSKGADLDKMAAALRATLQHVKQ